MTFQRTWLMSAGIGAVTICLGSVAMADSIDPATFSAELAVGESVTIRKTVTVSNAPPTAAKIDVHLDRKSVV